MSFGARKGRPAPTATRATKPSTRNRANSRARAPRPRLSSEWARVVASEERVAATSSSQSDRLGEAALGEEGRRRTARTDRFLVDAQRPIEALDERAAETGGKRRARCADDLADAFQPDAIECGDGVVLETERGERQGGEHGGAAAGRDQRNRIGAET